MAISLLPRSQIFQQVRFSQRKASLFLLPWLKESSQTQTKTRPEYQNVLDNCRHHFCFCDQTTVIRYVPSAEQTRYNEGSFSLCLLCPEHIHGNMDRWHNLWITWCLIFTCGNATSCFEYSSLTKCWYRMCFKADINTWITNQRDRIMTYHGNWHYTGGRVLKC